MGFGLLGAASRERGLGDDRSDCSVRAQVQVDAARAGGHWKDVPGRLDLYDRTRERGEVSSGHVTPVLTAAYRATIDGELELHHHPFRVSAMAAAAAGAPRPSHPAGVEIDRAIHHFRTALALCPNYPVRWGGARSPPLLAVLRRRPPRAHLAPCPAPHPPRTHVDDQYRMRSSFSRWRPKPRGVEPAGGVSFEERIRRTRPPPPHQQREGKAAEAQLGSPSKVPRQPHRGQRMEWASLGARQARVRAPPLRPRSPSRTSERTRPTELCLRCAVGLPRTERAACAPQARIAVVCG